MTRSGSTRHEPGNRGSQVRRRLAAGGRRIRTLGPPSEGCMQTPRSPPIASSRIALVDRDNPHKEVRFARDSPLEEAGFEPLVPRRRPVSSCCRSRSRRLFRWRGCNRHNPISKACVARGPMVESGFLQRRSVGNPASGPSLSAITCGGARPRMQPEKLQAVRPVDPLPCRQWKLLKINVSESMLSPSLPISLHARRSPSAAGRFDREPKWQSFRFVISICSDPILRFTV
jgi:hypothetical protein